MLKQIHGMFGTDRAIRGTAEELVEVTLAKEGLMSLPGVGMIVAARISLEIGEVTRFPYRERLAAYAGTAPRVHASDDHTQCEPTRPEVNRYLKRPFVEAASSGAVNHAGCSERQTSRSTSGCVRARSTAARRVPCCPT